MTGKYLDTTGLSYLWDKITAAFASKELLTGLINNKVDKISTSTDNAVVRFNGTSSAIQNSGVTINDSNHVTAAKFITSGGTSSQVVLGNGNLQAVNTLPQYEAYLEWGGKNFSGSYGVADAAMVDELGAPRTMFAKAAGIVVEYSRDGGSTWIDYEATDAQKTALFSNGTALLIGKSNTAGASSADYMLRVTLRTSTAGIYTSLNKFVILIGSNGSQGCYCTIRTRLQSNYENDVDTWVTRAEQIPISGWSGYNVININGFTTYGNVKTSQWGEIQFIFGCTGYVGSSSGLTVYKIFGFGGVGWVTPSNMAKTGHLYAFDPNQNATFPNQIEAVKFKKSGGTSSQFLKADGSVDSNTYLTTAPVTSVNGKTGAVTLTIPSKTSDLTNDSNFIQDKGRSSSSSSTSIIDGAFSNEDIVLTCNNHNAAVNVNPMGVDIIANWNGGSNGVNNNGTSNVNINTSQGKAYYNNKEIATVDQIVTPPVTSVNGQTGAVTLSIPAAVTESTVAGWGFTKNVGTITGVTGSNGLTGSGTSGSVTISHAAPSTSPAKTTQAVYPIKIDQYGHITSVGTAVTIPTVPTNVSAFTNDAGYATDMNLSTISSSSTSATLSNTNTYYRHLSTGIGTLNITLPDVSSATKVQHIMLYIKTGSSPTLNVTSSGSATITYVDGFEIEASKEYEISFLWNGAKWIVAYNTLAS